MADLSEKLLGNDEENDNGNAAKDDLSLAPFAPLVPDEQVLVDEALNRGGTSTTVVRTSGNSSGVTVGEKQPDGFRDVFAAVLFLAHLGVIFYLAFAWGFPSLNYQVPAYGTTDDFHFSGILFLCLISSFAALLLAGVALRVMTTFSEVLIQISLGFSILSNFVLALFFLSQAYWLGMGMALACGAIASCYAYAVWRRIALAAANLVTALTAIRANAGIIVAAYGITALVQVYTIFWLVAWLGVYVRHADCHDDVCTSHLNGLVVLLFLLSYFWTASVGKNLLHVTVSGVVGTFVFTPDDASHFCSPSITDSLARASTWSFGSICLGSLLTAVLQILYQLCRHARRQQSSGSALLLCVLECVVGFLERLVTYFNKWAYCYIGLYGYDYLTAGRNVVQLFRDRGWTTLISDDLVTNTLSLTSLVVGLCTGAVGVLLAHVVPQWVEVFSGGTAMAFFLSAMTGTALSYILFLSVVGAAVDTVIVLFAEAPLELERNHPGLYRQMVAAWRQQEEFRL